MQSTVSSSEDPAAPDALRWGAWSTRRSGPWIVAALFFALGALWLGASSNYHGDERFYTDAAIRMLTDGEWFAPKYADGSARLNKPLLVYWIVVAGFKLFGVGLFGSRVLFLAAGALLVALVGTLTRALFPSEPRAPLLASCMAASSITFTALATRATPDILVALAATVAWIGLARGVVGREPGAAPGTWLWIGIGLTAAAKGGLAILLVLFALAAIARCRSNARRLRDWFPIPALGAAAAVVALALGPLAVSTGAPGGPGLLEDQVAGRIAGSVTQVLAMGAGYVESLLSHFTPWLVALAIGAVSNRVGLAAAWREHRRAFAVVFCFVALVLAVFAFANIHRGRYLVIAHAPLTCALSVLVLRVLHLRVLRAAFGALLGFAALLGATLAVALARIDVVACIALAGVAATAGVSCWVAPRSTRALGFSALALTATFVAAPALRDVFARTPLALAAREPRIDAIGGFDSAFSGMLSVLSAGRLTPRFWPDVPPPAAWERADVVLVVGKARQRAAELGYRLEPSGTLPPRLRTRDIWPLLTSSDPIARIDELGEPVSLAYKPTVAR